MRLSGKTEQWELECARARYLIKKYFGSLEFKEDTHQYFLPQPDGTKKEYDCVSHFTKQWDPEEDWDEIRRRYAQKHGQTPEYWKEKWDFNAKVACTNGTTVHEFAESCGWLSNGETDKICESAVDQFDPLTFSMIPYEGSDKWLVKDAEDDWTRWVRKEKAAKQFYDDLLSGKYKGLHFCMAETKVYTSVGPFAEVYNNNYAGTFDLLLYYQHPTDPEQSGFCIFDWKGLPLDTPILTENGFVNMGDLQEGMYVFDKDGNKAKILHCSEIHHNPCYKIKFDNNDEIVADIDHRWLISFIHKCKYKGEYKDYGKEVVMTTKELKEYLDTVKDKHRSDLIPKIINAKPINCDEKELPIDPYVLGVWLGDGSADCGIITNPYEEIFNEIERRGYKVGPDVSHGSSGKAMMRTVYDLSGKLRQLNLLRNKHIPEIYLLASYQQRLDLLRGFMDADGYYHKKRNRFVTDTTKENQKNFVVTLLGTLGVKPTVIDTVSKCEGKTYKTWDICFYMQESPFLMRKHDIRKNRDSFKYRNIVSVEEVEQVPTRCIEVDSPSHTYLATEKCIVTHNTNVSLTKDFKKPLLSPFQNMNEEPLSHYTMQLSCYQIPMEAIGLKVIARRLIHLKNEGGYDLISVPDVTDKIKDALRGPYKEIHVEKKGYNEEKE